jgi:hypothetical protein
MAKNITNKITFFLGSTIYIRGEHRLTFLPGELANESLRT